MMADPLLTVTKLTGRRTKETYEPVISFNSPHHTMWALYAIYMQNRNKSSTEWNGYPYKANIDAITDLR